MIEVLRAIVIIGALIYAGHIINWWLTIPDTYLDEILDFEEDEMAVEPSNMKFTVGDQTFAMEFKRERKDGAPYSNANVKSHDLSPEEFEALTPLEKKKVEDAAKAKYRFFTTTVTIREVNDQFRANWPVKRSYTVGCHHKDRFNLSKGREAALRGICIQDQKVVGHHNGAPLYGPKYYVSGVTKEFVEKMWDAYFNR